MRGARMFATLPISDEILIFPSTVLKGGDELKPYALAFAIPNNTPGLSFQCREPLDLGRSHRDHPLGSRFDEMDAMVFFDDVLVPWDRVFLMNDVELANQAYAETGAVLHMAHQVVNLKIAKTEAFLGVIQAVIDMIGTGELPARAGDGCRGHHRARDHEGSEGRPARPARRRTIRRDDAGTCPARRRPQLLPGVYKRLVEILQLVPSSGLIMIPTEADFAGPRGADIDKYLQGRGEFGRGARAPCSGWRGT